MQYQALSNDMIYFIFLIFFLSLTNKDQGYSHQLGACRFICESVCPSVDKSLFTP